LYILYLKNSLFYNALLEIKGSRVSVPLYVQRDEENGLEKAREVAKKVMADIAEHGEFDLLRLATSGEVPLLDFIDRRLSEMTQGRSGKESIQYRVHPKGGSRKTLDIKLYEGNNDREFASARMHLPSSANRELIDLCVSQVVKTLGADHRRTPSKTSPRPKKDRTDDLVSSRPSMTSISRPSIGMLQIFLGWKDGLKVGFSSKTHSRDVAEGRLKGVLELIDTVVADGGAIPISEIRQYLEIRGKWRDYHESGKGGRGR
jgi:hypothetical protein